MKSCNCWDCRSGRERREEIRRGGVVEEVLPHRSVKKNTKKWCKGKVGREHVNEWVEYHLYGKVWYKNLTCKNCGKVSGWSFPRY